MSKSYRGLFTFDEYNHKYVPVALADGIIDLLDTTDYVPAEPLIKDEKIRKAVKAWAEANAFTNEIEVHSLDAGTSFSVGHWSIEFIGYFIYDLKIDSTYTITELCGSEE